MAKNDSGNAEIDLDRIALEEIIKETKRGKERAETMGPMGWVKCPLVPTNKRFFRNVLIGTQKQNNRIKDLQRKHQSMPKHRGKLTSHSSNSSHSSSRDKNIPRKTKDNYERTGQSYLPSKYSNQTASSARETSTDKYKQSTKDNVKEKRSYHRHSDRCNDEKPHIEIKQSKKRKLEENTKKHEKQRKTHHKHAKKRK